MPSKIAYWDIRGLAEPVRLLLEYAGENYEDVRYPCGDAPDYDRSAWLDVKFTFGLDFPNLPYYIDGDLKLTQSNTILRHLARKHNLYGSGPAEQAHVDLLLDMIMDVRNGFVGLCYGPGFTEEKKATYLEGAKGHIANFEKYLGDKKFFVGDKVTVCDFHIYEMITQHTLMDAGVLSAAPKLKAYLKRFEELPAIKKYLSSDRFKARPINNKSASFK